MSEGDEELSAAVKRQIEKNRQKAIILKRSKLISHPYAKGLVIFVVIFELYKISD